LAERKTAYTMLMNCFIVNNNFARTGISTKYIHNESQRRPSVKSLPNFIVIVLFAIAVLIIYPSISISQAASLLQTQNPYPPATSQPINPEAYPPPLPTPPFSPEIPEHAYVPPIEYAITFDKNEVAQYQLLSTNHIITPLVPITATYQGTLPTKLIALDETASSETDRIEFVDNWSLLWQEDFENTCPLQTCEVNDQSPDPYERYWDDDNYRAATGNWAA
jgi:hypothetical protein